MSWPKVPCVKLPTHLFYWSFVRKTYGDTHSKTGKVSNLVNGPILLNVPPEIGKILNFISEFRIKSCGIYPPVLTSDGNFGKSTFPCTVQWCIQICHKPFSPSHEGHLKMLIYSIFYWKYRFEMAVMYLILQENPIKDINVNLSFLSSRWKVVECIPPRLEKFLTSFLSSGSKVVEYTPHPQLGIWWKFGKIYFFMYCPMMHANLP